MGGQDDGLLQGARSPYKATIVPIQNGHEAAAKAGRGSGKARQYIAAIMLNVAALAGGTIMGWPSPAGPLLTNGNASLVPLDADGDGLGEAVSEEHMSWLASVNFLVGFVGTLMFGALADRFGRRVAGLVVAVPYVVSWILIATGNSLAPLYVARILGGIGCGGIFVVCPLYVAEMAEDENRGALGTFLATGLNAGILVAFVVSTFTTYRSMPLVLLSLPLLYFLFVLRLPETPVYLVKRGRTADARRALAWYRGGPSARVDAELDAMLAAAKREESAAASSGVSLSDLVQHRGTRRALVQSLALLANQQLCGVIAVLNYTEAIFTQAGSSMSPATASIVVAAVQAIATYLSSFLMNFGRKPLLLWSNLVMAACLITLGGCFFAGTEMKYDTSAISWLPVLAMSLYVVSFALGLGPVPLVLLSETFSTRVRSMATAIGIGCQTMCAFLSTKFLPNVKDALGMHGCMWVFASFCLVGAAFVVFVVIETKGKKLEYILAEFHGELPEAPVGHDAEARGDEDDDVFRMEDARHATRDA